MAARFFIGTPEKNLEVCKRIMNDYSEVRCTEGHEEHFPITLIPNALTCFPPLDPDQVLEEFVADMVKYFEQEEVEVNSLSAHVEFYSFYLRVQIPETSVCKVNSLGGACNTNFREYIRGRMNESSESSRIQVLRSYVSLLTLLNSSTAALDGLVDY